MTSSAPESSRRPRAVLYSRLSRATLASTSLEGQSEDLHALADREGWDVVATFVDEGLSGGKRRAAAEESLRMLADGEADILAAYAVDRYSRQGVGEDAEVVRVVRRGVEAARRSGTPAPRVVFVREGIDSSADPTHWAMRYALASELAYSERQLMVARRKASIRRLQAAGRFSGRGPAPWGYRSAPAPGAGRTLVIDPAEAEVIRDTARRLIEGESTTSVCRDLTARGIPTPRSAYRKALLKGEPTEGLATGYWAPGNLVQALLSQSLLGRVAVKTSRSADDGLGRYGELVLDADGNPLQAFEPVLTIGEHLALRDRFALGQGRGQNRKRKAARLGSDLVYCGVCGFKVYVVTSDGVPYYRCSASPRGALVHPGGLRVKASIVEAELEAIYLRSFGHLPAIQYVETDTTPALTESVLRLTERIQGLSARMAAPGADVLTLAQELAALQTERSSLLDAPASRSVTAHELGGTWADIWASSDTAARRQLLVDAYDHVELHPADASRRLVPVPKPSREEAPAYYAG